MPSSRTDSPPGFDRRDPFVNVVFTVTWHSANENLDLPSFDEHFLVRLLHLSIQEPQILELA